jgi:hypothetical protein
MDIPSSISAPSAPRNSRKPNEDGCFLPACGEEGCRRDISIIPIARERPMGSYIRKLGSGSGRERDGDETYQRHEHVPLVPGPRPWTISTQTRTH